MAGESADVKKTGDGQDLSMEDILQSIRKIIAEDGEDANVKPEAKANGQEAESPAGSDVLELTEMVEETVTEEISEEPPAPADVLKEIDDAVAESAPKAEAPPPPAAKAEDVEQEAVAETPEETEVAPIAKVGAAVEIEAETNVPAPVSESARLLSKTAASVSQASLKKMVETHKATTPMPHFRSGTTLEDLVLESLKPMLKQWLDTNLPPMVERIVEREIRKLVD